MGKEEHQVDAPAQETKEPPKKIIKKLPFKGMTKMKKGEEDEFKYWKPIKISEK